MSGIMSVRQTQFKRLWPGLLVVCFLLAIELSTKCSAQQADLTSPESDPALVATAESPELESANLIPVTGEDVGTKIDGTDDADSEPLPAATDDGTDDALQTDVPLLEKDVTEEAEEQDEEETPDSKVGATPGDKLETEGQVEAKVAEVDATAESEPQSDSPSDTPDNPDATAPVDDELVATKEAPKPLVEDLTQPEPDPTNPTDKPKQKKKKKKPKKKKTGKKKTVDPTVPEPVDPQPVDPQPVDPQPVDPQPVDPKPVVDPIPVDPPTEKPTPPKPPPTPPKPVEPKPVEPKPVEPKPVEPKPVEPKPVKPKPAKPKPVKPKPVKPAEPVTEGPCVDIYTDAQKRQACSGAWKEQVRILNLQVDKLKMDNEKLWMQVTEIHGKIKYSRDIISESHLSTNTWKRRVAFPGDAETKADVKDCNDALGKGSDKPGVYLLNPDGSPYNVRALCVNGWTIVQRRFDGSEDFNREFDDYVSGFGNFSGEFFLGLENLHRMTKNKAYTLRVDVKGYSGKWYYGVYEDFMLSDEIDEYRLSLGNMSAGNYFDGFENGRDQQFSTRNRDNDEWRAGNCAEHYGGGWWSSTCSTNLNQRWCRTGCLRWATKRVVSSIIRIKPSEAVVEEDRSENPNPGGLTLDEVPA